MIKLFTASLLKTFYVVLISFVLTFAGIDTVVTITNKLLEPPPEREPVQRQTNLDYYSWNVQPKINNPNTLLNFYSKEENPLTPLFTSVENRCVRAGDFRQVIQELGFKRFVAGLDGFDFGEQQMRPTLGLVELWINQHRQFMVAYSFMLEDRNLDYACILIEGEDLLVDNGIGALFQHPFYGQQKGI